MVKKTEGIEEVKAKSYVKPHFTYGDDVIIKVPENLKKRESVVDDSYFPVACFYEGETGTVVDCWQFGNDVLSYTVLLDYNLGTEYDDQKNKCITVSEKYLEGYSWEEECEKEKTLDTISSIKSLAEEKLKSEDIGDVLIANVMLDLIDKAKKYDDLQK